MPTLAPVQSWPDSRGAGSSVAAAPSAHAQLRLWQAFMAARLVLAVVLVGLQVVLQVVGASHNRVLLGVGAAYLVLTLLSRSLISPRPLGQSFNRVWGALVGLDILTFTALQVLQGSAASGAVNYTPLYALPVLLASVLGSLRLALGTAAGVTLLMLAAAVMTAWQSASYATSSFVQPALSGVGFFAVAWLSNQLATRLADEGARAHQSQLAASIQRQVNELVIESLTDGVLVVDEHGRVRAANPAARSLLDPDRSLHGAIFDLHETPSWQPLLRVARRSIGANTHLAEDVTLNPEQVGSRRLHVKTRLATGMGESLCVLFLQDQREMEARLRTEKMASMGRLSTAVAHEIRNPLSAITQANALLDEDLTDPRHKRLTGMVDQNAKRLEKIVNDILNVSRVQPAQGDTLVPDLPLALTAHRICTEWAHQCAAERRIVLSLPLDGAHVRFDPEHLRRVLINLLDNALRHTEDQPATIQVYTDTPQNDSIRLTVWSRAAPPEPSVQNHLFEPFFSSDSRSSGLGLYICRELCERHEASLHFQRQNRPVAHSCVDGNAFVMTFALAPNRDPMDHETTTPWQPKLH